MSIHLAAKQNEVAETVLLPGDPMRAKFIAENILEDAFCYNNVRGMLGFTGNYKGKRVSVQGTGMGVPSISIYVTELIKEHNVKNLIRIGTCGTIQEDVKIRDIILAMTASTTSNINKSTFAGNDFAPCANFELLSNAYNVAKERGMNAHVGSVLTEDNFYNDDPEHWRIWAKYGILGLEMETAALYTIAIKNRVKALSILTVSDSILTHEITSSEEREKTFTNMVELALETASR